MSDSVDRTDRQRAVDALDGAGAWFVVAAGEENVRVTSGTDGDDYDSQLRRWADGEYKPMDRATRGDLAVRFAGGDGE